MIVFVRERKSVCVYVYIYRECKCVCVCVRMLKCVCVFVCGLSHHDTGGLTVGAGTGSGYHSACRHECLFDRNERGRGLLAVLVVEGVGDAALVSCGVCVCECVCVSE